MDMFDSLFSPSGMLNEQVARHVFEILPEDGPILVILDRHGNFWPSDSQKFNDLPVSETFIREICNRVDDGCEPVMSKIEDHTLVASQLHTQRTNCGYVVIIGVCEKEDEDETFSFDLAEIVINQISLIASLLEKNNLLYELQMKKLSEFTQDHKRVN